MHRTNWSVDGSAVRVSKPIRVYNGLDVSIHTVRCPTAKIWKKFLSKKICDPGTLWPIVALAAPVGSGLLLTSSRACAVREIFSQSPHTCVLFPDFPTESLSNCWLLFPFATAWNPFVLPLPTWARGAAVVDNGRRRHIDLDAGQAHSWQLCCSTTACVWIWLQPSWQFLPRFYYIVCAIFW